MAIDSQEQGAASRARLLLTRRATEKIACDIDGKALQKRECSEEISENRRTGDLPDDSTSRVIVLPVRVLTKLQKGQPIMHKDEQTQGQGSPKHYWKHCTTVQYCAHY